MNRYHKKQLKIFRRRENTFMRHVKSKDDCHKKMFESMRKAARKINEIRMGHLWDKPWMLVDCRGVRKEAR